MKKYSYLILLAGIAFGCQSSGDQTTDTQAVEVPTAVAIQAERAALRDADNQYGQSVLEKDPESLFGYYSSNAMIYPPDGAPISGAEGIQEFITGFMSTPGFSANIREGAVIEVSEGMDIGYTINIIDVTATDADGNAVNEVVRDFHLWKKQEDGSWKVIVDIWNTEAVEGSE